MTTSCNGTATALLLHSGEGNKTRIDLLLVIFFQYMRTHIAHTHIRLSCTIRWHFCVRFHNRKEQLCVCVRIQCTCTHEMYTQNVCAARLESTYTRCHWPLNLNSARRNESFQLHNIMAYIFLRLFLLYRLPSLRANKCPYSANASSLISLY